MKNIYGKNISSIFYNWMGIKSRPKEMQKRIDQLFNEIDKETPESLAEAQKLFLELKDELGRDDEVIIEANILLELIETEDQT